jgi:hypothetical protein
MTASKLSYKTASLIDIAVCASYFEWNTGRS